MRRGKLKKKENKIVNVIRSIDMTTLSFFIGILLAVNALGYVGILDHFANAIFGQNPASQPYRIMASHSVIGVVSALVDNVPITAAVMDMLPDGISYQYWVLLAITAGTGGSLLVIGSAAGVAAMGQAEHLSVSYYFKRGTLPAFLGYLGAIFVWWLQMLLMGDI
jgi:Na+/H+ antiporter NhaD/arsenite permease-like protein